MSTINFRQATAQADAILSKDKKKLTWSLLPFDQMPKDIAALAVAAVEAEIGARSAKAALQAALDDKVEAPSGKRLVVTLGRDVGPNTSGVFTAWADASASATRVITFDQFIRG